MAPATQNSFRQDRTEGVVRRGVLPSSRHHAHWVHVENLELRVLFSTSGGAGGATVDASFGGAGVVEVDLGAPQRQPQSIGIQSDGKVVVAGAAGNTFSTDGFALARYNPDGSLDTSFGPNGTGTVVTEFPGTGDGATTSQVALGIGPDGSIYVAGSNTPFDLTAMAGDLILARYTPAGTLDAAFGSGGFTITDVAGRGDVPTEVLVQPNGTIVVVGFDTAGWQGQMRNDRHIFLIRYDGRGNLDPSFGTIGKVITDIPTSVSEEPTAAALQQDGKTVIIAQVTSPAGGALSSLLRYNADGTMDAAFPAIEPPPGVEFRDVAVTAPGRIVVAGTAGPAALGARRSDQDLVVLAYTAQGSLDTAFGDGGRTFVNIGKVRADTNRQAHSYEGDPRVTLSSQGQITVAGSTSASGGGVALARLNATGRFDRSFSRSGKTVLRVDAASASTTDLAVLPDGRAMVLAESSVPNRAFLARFATGLKSGGAARESGRVSLAGGVLRIRGTHGDDQIVASRVTPPDPAGEMIDVMLNGTSQRFPGRDVRRIIGTGGRGNDTITIDSGITISVTLLGGPGNDTLTGGGGRDRIVGGAGVDNVRVDDKDITRGLETLLP